MRKLFAWIGRLFGAPTTYTTEHTISYVIVREYAAKTDTEFKDVVNEPKFDPNPTLKEVPGHKKLEPLTLRDSYMSINQACMGAGVLTAADPVGAMGTDGAEVAKAFLGHEPVPPALSPAADELLDRVGNKKKVAKPKKPRAVRVVKEETMKERIDNLPLTKPEDIPPPLSPVGDDPVYASMEKETGLKK